MNYVKISPIFYQGCKKKLIKKGLIDLFPKDIDTFYDLFGGSGIVSMNVKANRYILNDIEPNLYDLYNMFKNYNANTIIININDVVYNYELATIRTKRNKFFDLDIINKYKENYYKFRKDYNTHKNVLELYVLLIFCFSQQMRFNNKTNDFNMPCGNDCFSKKNEQYIKEGCDFFSQDNVELFNTSYEKILTKAIWNKNNKDFVYLDIPYGIEGSGATYNENGGWTKEKELEVYSYLTLLNNRGINWGLSNCFSSKGKTHQMLIDWCDKNKWNVHHFDVKYSAMGKGNSNNDEVYICNYTLGEQ